MSRKSDLFGDQTGMPASPVVVLHIDDDANDLELLKAAAHKTGAPITLHSAVGSEQAIDYLECVCSGGNSPQNPLPSVILLDMNMPRSTGLDLLRWVGAHPVIRKIPVVVLSGSESPYDIQTAYAAGAASYMVKPPGFKALVELVSQISGRWCGSGSSHALGL